MNVRHPPARGRLARLLSLREVATLAGVTERRLRKDIEAGVLASPLVWQLPDAKLCFPWEAVIAISAVYRGRVLNKEMRRVALDRLHQWSQGIRRFGWSELDVGHASPNLGGVGRNTPALIEIEQPIVIDIEAVWRDTMPKLASYMRGLDRIEENPEILGGDAVFKGTRLSVYHVGKMVANGEKIANILEDYPYLDESDLDFAAVYYRAHPPVGRPRAEDRAGTNAKARSR